MKIVFDISLSQAVAMERAIAAAYATQLLTVSPEQASDLGMIEERLRHALVDQAYEGPDINVIRKDPHVYILEGD